MEDANALMTVLLKSVLHGAVLLLCAVIVLRCYVGMLLYGPGSARSAMCVCRRRETIIECITGESCRRKTNLLLILKSKEQITVSGNGGFINPQMCVCMCLG